MLFRSVGIEPGAVSAMAASSIAGIEVRRKVFDESDFTDGEIDFVSMIHVLDHLINPMIFLKKLRRKVAEGGICFVVVHNIDSFIARVSGIRWPPLGVIHFDYFTPATLRKIFELAGWNVLQTFHTVNYFPLYHLVRFCPGIPPLLRRFFYYITCSKICSNIYLRLQLGNIGVIAV